MASDFTSRQPRNETKSTRKTTKRTAQPLTSLAKSRPTNAPRLLSNMQQGSSQRSTKSRTTKVSLRRRTSTKLRRTSDRRSTLPPTVFPSFRPGNLATVAQSSHVGVDAVRSNSTLYLEGIRGKEILLFRIGLGLTLVTFVAAVCVLVSGAERTKSRFMY